MQGRFLLVLFVLLVVASPAVAQVVLTLEGFVPPATATSATLATIRYFVASSAPDPVTVTFFRNDGTTVPVTGLIPGAGPFFANIPLPTGVDGQSVTISAVAQQPPVGALYPGNRTLSIRVDDTGPLSFQITAPVFPLSTFAPTFLVQGTVTKTGGPETGGQVTVRYPAGGNVVVGGGAIRADGGFGAVVDASVLPSGQPVSLRFETADALGNAGATTDVQVTAMAGGGSATLTGLSLTPPSGTITNQAGVLVRGTVTGDNPPFLVHFLVDGSVESSLTGLAAGTTFAHTLSLPGDGTHSIAVRAKPVGGSFAPQVVLGTITLDRRPPLPPTILEPNPASGPFYTNQPTFTVTGYSNEKDTNPNDGRSPKVLLVGPSGVSFIPAQPQPLAGDGRFETTVDISALADGAYEIQIYVIDEAGNTSALGPAAVLALSRSGTAGPRAPRSSVFFAASSRLRKLSLSPGLSLAERLRRVGAARAFRSKGRRLRALEFIEPSAP